MLSNVARHAHATEAAIDIEVDGHQVMVRVADNGVGPPADPAGGHGNGLPNLQKRARRLGGFFTMAPGDGGGTIVEWCAPLAH
jgi:signal transduction histidine kinase